MATTEQKVSGRLVTCISNKGRMWVPLDKYRYEVEHVGSLSARLMEFEPKPGDVRRKREQPDGMKVRLERVEKGFKKPQGHVVCPDCHGRGFDEYERYEVVEKKSRDWVGGSYTEVRDGVYYQPDWITFTIPCQTCTGLGFVPEKKNRIELAEGK